MENSEQPNKRSFRLKQYQDDFTFSEKRYPAIVGAWGTGKDLCSIIRGVMLSNKHKKNLGMIARAEFTDLQDSTIKDFQDYTGLKVDSGRNVTLPNGSVIMFRHLEELSEKNLNNMNLGWFCIIQADEVENDSVFMKLTGRLRRCHNQCKQKGLDKCLCSHSGFISANANGEDWICNLWGSSELGIKGKLQDAELIEAKTFENADVLPQAFINSLQEVKRTRPEMYARFVENSRRVGEEKFVVLPYSMVSECIDIKPLIMTLKKKITVCDPAEGDFDADGKDDDGEGGGDETVIYDFEDSKIVDQEIYRDATPMDTVGRIQAHAKKNSSNLICVDKIGIGSGIYARLVEIFANDKNMTIYGFDSRISAPEGIDDQTYANYKTYAWFKARDKYFRDRLCSVPNDPELIRQLTKIRYRYTSGGKGGQYILLPKRKMKKILNCSPDRAEAYVMGLDALDRAEPISGKELFEKNPGWCHPRFRAAQQDHAPHLIGR